MDLVSITLSMCIGNAVAWVMAIYTGHGARNLIWNVAIGAAGAALCGLAFGWVAPSFRVSGLVFGGPVCAVLAILAADAVRTRIAPHLNS